jgi:hypothetical protein
MRHRADELSMQLRIPNLEQMAPRFSFTALKLGAMPTSYSLMRRQLRAWIGSSFFNYMPLADTLSAPPGNYRVLNTDCKSSGNSNCSRRRATASTGCGMHYRCSSCRHSACCICLHNPSQRPDHTVSLWYGDMESVSRQHSVHG